MGEPIRVLVVDNDPSFLADMKDSLTHRGFEVEIAVSGPDAMRRARESRNPFQVAVIDQVLGPPNGIEIMVAIRQVCPAVETIILTGLGDMAPGEKAMDLGAYRYMSKPVVAEELALNIRTAARLGQEQQRRLALEALVRSGQTIGTAQTEEMLYETLHGEATKLLPGLSAFLVSRFDEQTGVVSFPYACREKTRLKLPSRRGHKGITELVLRQGQPLLLPLGDEQLRREEGLDPHNPQLEYCTSEVAAPMFLEGRAVGAINALSFEADVRYTREHEQVFQAFANQAAVEIRNVLQRIEADQLRKASEALAGIQSQDAVLYAIVEQAHQLIGSDFTGLILQEPDGTLRKIRPVIPEHYFDRFEEPRQQGGVTRWVADKREPRVIHDTQLDPLVKESVWQAQIRSMLAFPLMRGDRVLGVLFAHTHEHRYFVQHDVDLWRTFATQAASVLAEAMEKEREIEDARRLADEIGSLADRMDLEETMRRVAGASKALLRADTCRLFYVDPPTQRIMDSVWADGDPAQYRLEDEPRCDGTTRYVLETHLPLFCPSAGAAERPAPVQKLLDLGLRSSASLPLIHGTRAIAVAQCAYLTRQEPFDEHTQTLFEALAGRAAVALDGARRDRLDEIWNHLDRAIAECIDLKELYKLFADHALRAFNADFAVFYPYDPTVPPGKLGLKKEEAVFAGVLLTSWEPPKGGHDGGVHREMEQRAGAVLIVNDLDARGGQLTSRLSEREKVKAFVSLRLDVRPAGEAKAQIAGVLFLNYRQVTAFERADLVDLQRAGVLVAASIRRLTLREQRFRQLRAVVEILEAFRARQYGDVILTRIAQATRGALSVDTCTVHEYDQEKGGFSSRGAAGLEVPETPLTLPDDYKAWFLDQRECTVIQDAPRDVRMQAGGFVLRERIQSTVVYPLYVEDEPMGLLFASFRYRTEPTWDELETMGLFANIASLVLHQARMRGQLSTIQARLERDLILTTVAMVENTWRHSIVNAAAAILNWVGGLEILLDGLAQKPTAMRDVPTRLAEIDRLAREIAEAPPRIPEKWELIDELIPLSPLIEEACHEGQMPTELKAGPRIELRTELCDLGDVQVWGNRRRLIYAVEALLQNSRRAMPEGGTILITGQREGTCVEIRVQDTGIGVRAEQRATLFRGRPHKAPGQQGMGIGGLIAATIVEDHGGVITLERPGPGDTTVLIRLPISEGAGQ